MKFCKFIKVDGGVQCECCKFYLKGNYIPENIKRNCQAECAQYPSVYQMGKNLISALINHAADGFKNVDEEEVERRMEICNGCEKYDKLQNRCVECGCYLSWKDKMKSSHCPLGKW